MNQKERAATSTVKGLDGNKSSKRGSEERKTRVILFGIGCS